MTLARSGAALDAVVRVERSGGFVLEVCVEGDIAGYDRIGDFLVD